MIKKRNPVSFRLSDEAVALLAKLASALGITQTAVLELAIRQFSKRNKTS